MSTVLRLALVAPLLLLPATASAGECHVVAVDLTPAPPVGSSGTPSQMVVWVETASGTYVDTVFITQQTGSFGLGNRPGRFDFNSGPMWPYGRRITTFPVWAHRTMNMDGSKMEFGYVDFQNVTGDPDDCFSGSGSTYTQCGENNLSHPFSQSSRENHFCQPLLPADPKWATARDAMTCATAAFTDKGKFVGGSKVSLYPARIDLARTTSDSPSVDSYKGMNPFDTVSRATPTAGMPTTITWPIPSTLTSGDYVVYVEVSQEFDSNGSYNSTTQPSPEGCPSQPPFPAQCISWGDYGLPYRGQPSIIYAVPFAISSAESVASTTSYAGYGDPAGADGALRPPDSTITTDTPGSGLGRLELVSDNGTMYRVRVDSRPETDNVVPGAAGSLAATDVGPSTLTLSFRAPGDDGQLGKVARYEVKYRAGSEITDANFADSQPITAALDPVDPGQLQTVQLTGLLPETDYGIGVKAIDNCGNDGPLTTLRVTTADRQVGEVDACFVATAAFGSVMANDVELLRHFRDSLLQRTVLGELFVETYYTFGPPVAGVVGQSDLLRSTARDALAPLIAWVRGLAF